MDRCAVGFNFERLTGSESLQVLSMSEVRLLDYGLYYDEQKTDSNEEGMQIEISDLEFVKGLPMLEVLDISNNPASSEHR